MIALTAECVEPWSSPHLSTESRSSVEKARSPNTHSTPNPPNTTSAPSAAFTPTINDDQIPSNSASTLRAWKVSAPSILTRSQYMTASITLLTREQPGLQGFFATSALCDQQRELSAFHPLPEVADQTDCRAEVSFDELHRRLRAHLGFATAGLTVRRSSFRHGPTLGEAIPPLVEAPFKRPDDCPK